MTLAYTVYQSMFFIIVIIFFNFAIYDLIPFMQPKLGDTIDDNQFKKKKLLKLAFLFKPIGGGSSSEYGVIYPMFYLHLLGYLLGITTTTMILIFAIAGMPIIIILRIVTYILMSYTIIVIVIVNILGLISRKHRT